jgi:O-antigen/teichoic acid export membrane protein
MRQKIKELTRDTQIYGISTIIGRFFNFLLVPFYTHFISPGEMGIFTNVYAYIAFLNIFYIYGMDAAFMKFRANADSANSRTVFSTANWFICLTTAGLTLLLLAARRPFLVLMAVPPEHADIFPYVLGILIFDTLSLIPYASLRMERRASLFATIRLANIGLNLGLNFLFFIKFHFGITAIFAANLAASFFSFLLLLPVVMKNLEWRLDGSRLRQMLDLGLPYLPAALASIVVQVIDRPVVLALTDATTLGLYQTGYKLGIFMMLVVSMFQYAWQPFFLSHAKDPDARPLFARVFTLFVLITALLWVLVSLFIEDAARIPLLSGRTLIAGQFLPGLVVVPIILLAYLFNGLYVNFQAGLTIANKTRYFPLVTGVGALVNVASNFLLIPRLGIIGAALATLFSYIVMAGVLLYFSQRFYPIPYEFGKVGRVLGLIGASTALYYFLYFHGYLTIGTKVLILLGFAISLSVLQVVNRREMKGLLQVLIGGK